MYVLLNRVCVWLNATMLSMADTTKALWENLHQQYMPVPNDESWGTTAHCLNQL